MSFFAAFGLLDIRALWQVVPFLGAILALPFWAPSRGVIVFPTLPALLLRFVQRGVVEAAIVASCASAS